MNHYRNCEFSYFFRSIIKVDVIVNSANPNLDLTQGRASSSLLAAAGSRIQRECQQNYPRGLRPGEIAVTSGGNLRCTAIYHGVLTRYSSQRDEKVSGHVCCTIRYTVLFGRYFNTKFPLPSITASSSSCFVATSCTLHKHVAYAR